MIDWTSNHRSPSQLTRPAPALCALLAIWTLSCSSGDSGAQAATEIAFVDFPAELTKASCALYDRCGGAIAQAFNGAEDCVVLSQKALQDGEFAAVEGAVRSGSVIYHPTRARECLDAIADGACDVLTGGLPVGCDAALEGTIELGGDCRVDAECGSQNFCDAGASCPGKCAPRGSAGASCSGEFACGRGLVCGPDAQCTEPIALGASCNERGAPCVAGSFCFGETQAAPGRCTNAETLFTTNQGQACTLATGPLCQPGLSCVADTAGTASCRAEVNMGEACQFGFPDPCGADAYCLADGSGAGTCTVLPDAGQPCAASAGPPCRPYARCDNGVCRNMQRLGGSCGQPDTCYSGRCDDGICQPTNACHR